MNGAAVKKKKRNAKKKEEEKPHVNTLTLSPSLLPGHRHRHHESIMFVLYCVVVSCGEFEFD